MNTTSHSSPLAEWIVDSTTASPGDLRNAADCSAIRASSSCSDWHADASAVTASTTVVHSARSRSEDCPGTADETILRTRSQAATYEIRSPLRAWWSLSRVISARRLE